MLFGGMFVGLEDEMQVYDDAEVSSLTDETESYDDLEFVIQGIGELLSSMHYSVSKLNVKNVKIINKILTRAEVAELLGQANALILPLAPFCKSGHPYRGMSSKLYEYQAVGKPIICCSNGVPSNYIKNTHSGLVVNPGDAEGVARAVLWLKGHPHEAMIMGKTGRKYVEDEATIEAIGLKIKKIFQLFPGKSSQN